MCRNVGNHALDYTLSHPRDKGHEIHHHENLKSNITNLPSHCWVMGLLQETVMISNMQFADRDSDISQCKILICHVMQTAKCLLHTCKPYIYIHTHTYLRLQCVFFLLGYDTLQWVPTFWRNILYIFNKASCSMVCTVQK